MNPFPSSLRRYKSIRLSNLTKPSFFQDKQSFDEGTWGELIVEHGAFNCSLVSQSDEVMEVNHLNLQNPKMIIPPSTGHKITPHSDASHAELNLYCHPHRYFQKKYHLGQVHSDLLYVYSQYFTELNKLNILDIGCGHGRNLLYLASLGHSITGLDINSKAIENIGQIAATESLTRAKAIVHDLNQGLPNLEQPFEWVIATTSLQFLNPPSIPPLLHSLEQATTPYGFHFFVFPIKDERFQLPSSFQYLANSSELYSFYQRKGWSIIEYKESVGQLHRLDASGKPIQGLFGLLLAQKNL